MTKVPLGSTGLIVTPLGYGASLIGATEKARRASDLRLLAFLDGGVTLVETASHYEGSEQLLSAALSDRLEELVIVGRFGTRRTLPDGSRRTGVLPVQHSRELNPAILGAFTTTFESAEYASGQPWRSPA